MRNNGKATTGKPDNNPAQTGPIHSAKPVINTTVAAATEAAKAYDADARAYTYQDDLDLVCTLKAVASARAAFVHNQTSEKLKTRVRTIVVSLACPQLVQL